MSSKRPVAIRRRTSAGTRRPLSTSEVQRTGKRLQIADEAQVVRQRAQAAGHRAQAVRGAHARLVHLAAGEHPCPALVERGGERGDLPGRHRVERVHVVGAEALEARGGRPPPRDRLPRTAPRRSSRRRAPAPGRADRCVGGSVAKSSGRAWGCGPPAFEGGQPSNAAPSLMACGGSSAVSTRSRGVAGPWWRSRCRTCSPPGPSSDRPSAAAVKRLASAASPDRQQQHARGTAPQPAHQADGPALPRPPPRPPAGARRSSSPPSPARSPPPRGTRCARSGGSPPCPPRRTRWCLPRAGRTWWGRSRARTSPPRHHGEHPQGEAERQGPQHRAEALPPRSRGRAGAPAAPAGSSGRPGG